MPASALAIQLQEGSAFLIVATRHPELALCDLEPHGCFSGGGLYLSWG